VNSSETKPCKLILIDAVLSSAARCYSRSKISNLLQFTSMHPKSKKKTIHVAINTGQLAYTFIKLGDNLTNNDRDRPMLIDISNSA